MTPVSRIEATDHGYRPLLFDRITVKTLQSDDYRRFIETAVLAPGCRLLLERHRRRPDWPYVETKFNPNTGCDLPEAAYQIVYVWLLGRGSEALDDHLRYLPRLETLSRDERYEMTNVFAEWIDRMTETIASLAVCYNGRLPFRVNRDGIAVDGNGRPVEVSTTVAGAGDVFGLKGLLSSCNPARQQLSRTLLQRAAALIRRDQIELEQKGAPQGRGQGMRMLMQGAGMCGARKAADPAAKEEALAAAALCLEEVLDTFYDSGTGLFSEFVDPETGVRSAYLDPGHANELVGLGLGMIGALDASPWADAWRTLIQRAKRELPRILLKATAQGFNPHHPGLYKAVDNRSGTPLNTDMPWWNLPETMRAAVRACAVADSESLRQECLDVYARCHNAYFSRYLNHENGLFPFQTIDGLTGRVTDVVPAVPEGDPLYHANGAFLDLLEVIEKV